MKHGNRQQQCRKLILRYICSATFGGEKYGLQNYEFVDCGGLCISYGMLAVCLFGGGSCEKSSSKIQTENECPLEKYHS